MQGGVFWWGDEQVFQSWGGIPFLRSGGNFPHPPSRENSGLYTYSYLRYLNEHLITRVLTCPERRYIKLFFQSALISQLCLHFFQKLKYNIFGKKDYSLKLFWVAVTIKVNTDEVKDTVITLGERNKGTKEQSSCGFHWRISRNHTSLRVLLRPWYG